MVYRVKSKTNELIQIYIEYQWIGSRFWKKKLFKESQTHGIVRYSDMALRERL